jgi:hypothetical protein
MQTTSVDAIRIATKGPGDVSGLISMISSGAIDPSEILAILGKTEGNGGVNDSRGNMLWPRCARRLRRGSACLQSRSSSASRS